MTKTFLSFSQKTKVANHLETNKATFEHMTDEGIALDITRVLGFTVSKGNISGLRRQLGWEPRRKMALEKLTAMQILAVAIRDLYAKLNEPVPEKLELVIKQLL